MTIRLVVLTQGGRPVAQIRNVRLKRSRSHYHKSRVQTSIEMPPIQDTDYEYEGLDYGLIMILNRLALKSGGDGVFMIPLSSYLYHHYRGLGQRRWRW